jgi:homospermidine synthase
MPKRESVKFPGRLVLLGFGSIGQAVLPVLFKELGIDPKRARIVKAHEDDSGVAAQLGVEVIVVALDEGNYTAVLEPLLEPGDFLLNLSVDVSSLAIIKLCRAHGVLYLDTYNEPWTGRYEDPESGLSNHGHSRRMQAGGRGHLRPGRTLRRVLARLNPGSFPGAPCCAHRHWCWAWRGIA